MKKSVIFAIILTGFIAMASQIVLVRELLVVFYGNELSVAFILAGWLVAGSIGSALLGKYADRIRPKVTLFSICQLTLAALLPLSIVLVRSIKIFLGANPGETIALFPVAASSFVILAPACVILGFLFALGCRIYETKPQTGAVSAGSVYVLEAIGAMAGGLITSFALVRLLGSMQIMALLGFLAAFSAMMLLWFAKEGLARLYIIVAAAAMLLADVLICAFGGWTGLDTYLARRQWPGYELISSKNSIYGNVSVLKSEGQFSFFDNGLHLYTIPDKQSSEEAVHFALLEHPHPKSALLIGGGVALVEEALKHPVERIDYVEFDPLIVEMAKDYLPAAYYSPLEDKRVSVIFMDGRRFIKETARKYDVIIINLGDPYTAQLNRFYTAEFYQEAKKALKGGGVISFGLGSSESFISADLAAFLRTVYATLKSAFTDIRVIPGETAYFIASDSAGLLTYDYNVLMDRAGKRRLDIEYVREYYLFSKLSPEKIAYTKKTVEAPAGAALNLDFRPVSYYYDIVFWTTRFKGSLLSKLLKAVTEKTVWLAVAVSCGITLLWGFFGARKKRPFAAAVMCAVTANGFSQMTFQIVVMLSFQILYGYLFYKLGLILTAFMAGLALGGWQATRTLPRLKSCERAVMAAQGALVIYPLALPVIFSWLAGSDAKAVSWAGANLVFAALPLFSGFIGGYIFPFANQIRLGRESLIGRVAGQTYGMDLVGSCLGALFTGAFLIPIIGIPNTCFAAAMVNLAVLIILAASYKAERAHS